MKDTIRKIIKEADSSRYAGYYTGPLTMGEIDWEKSALGPFTKKVSNFFNADLQYDSYDGTLDSHKKDSKKLETKSKRISKYNKKHPQANDEDGGIINQTPGKGKKIVPIKEWVELDSIDLNEDLAVWFGKKKKPKGSKQPKGPWVNICRKVDGKHPPCGRSDTSKGAYPKCRAAGVAGKMSDSEKRSACQQKRNAEKKDTQTGKGQKPVMTSYKKKKTNEDMKRIVRLTENDLSRIVKRVLVEQSTPPLNCDWFIMDTNLIDGQKGELQITSLGSGRWSIQKNTPNSNPSQINLTVPQVNQLQVSWNRTNKQITLTGRQTLNGMNAYNTLFNESNTATDCKVMYEIQTNQGPQLFAGTLKLETSNVQPKFLNNQVRLQNGAIITYGSDCFVGRKRRYNDDSPAQRGTVYGYIGSKGVSSFNDRQKSCQSNP